MLPSQSSVVIALLLFTTTSGNVVHNVDYEHKTWMLIPDDKGVNHLAILKDIFPREQRDVNEDVILNLYTNSDGGVAPYRLRVNDIENLQASDYNGNLQTKILIHGFTSNGNSTIIIDGKNAYLSKGDYNVIGVDWGLLCPSPNYAVACENAVLVGQHLAELIEFLVNEAGAKLEDFHVIGHSLGGQVSGLTGSKVTLGKIGRITGLDTAYPMFGNVEDEGRLDASDAVLVDTIHSCGGSLGFLDPYGLVDFYPNGGIRPQPGCGEDIVGSCSHSKSVEYFINSILEEQLYPVVQCANLDEAVSGSCTGTSVGYMGDSIVYETPGLYYVDTTA